MPVRTRSFQANFTKGELSPLLHARETAELYGAGVEVCENFLPLYHGGLTRRPGTRFVAGAKYPDRFCRLVAFEYSTADSYMIEVGHRYLRFYRNLNQIARSSGDARPYEVATRYSENQLRDLRFEQDENSLYIVHKDHPPRRLTRSGHTSWSLSEMSFTGQPTEWGTGNYPTLIAFFQQRAVFAGTRDQPQTFWFSKSGQPTHLKVGTNDDDAFKVTLKSGGVNALRFVLDGESLLVGTAGGTRVLGPSGGNGVMTLRSLDNKPQTETGAGKVAPVKVGASALFLSRDRRALHEMQYYFEKNRYESPALTELSEHITGAGIVELAYCQFPLSYLWMLRADGQLVSMTWHRQQNVVGFARHKLGGRTAERDWAEVESIAAVFEEGQGAENREVLWLSVKRRVNGADVRHIEILTPRFDTAFHQKSDAVFVDCSGTYRGTAATQINGFGHLVGEELDILADGAALPAVQVATDGTVTLPNGRQGTVITAGYGYASQIRTLSPPTPAEGGTGHGKKKRVTQMGVTFLDAAVLEYGPDLAQMTAHSFRTTETALGSAPDFFSDYLELPQDDGYSDRGQVWVRARSPLPLTLRGVVADVTAEG